LEQHFAQLPVGKALDVACGDGRNTLCLAQRHSSVDAVDIAIAGLMRAKREAQRRGLSAHFIQADLDAYPLPVNHYDTVVNVRYLNRQLLPALKRAVRAGGMVVFETFLREQAELGHPRNPAFLLERGELAHIFDDFELVTYEEGLFQTEKDRAFLARMLARRPGDWEPD
jgi:SAM-dependent methyltransferase